MIERLVSKVFGRSATRVLAMAVVGSAGLASNAEAAASIDIKFQSVNSAVNGGNTFIPLPGFSGATPGTIQSALTNQRFLQFNASTTTGLTVTAPTAEAAGTTNIAQPQIFTTTLNGVPVVTAFAANATIGPDVAGSTLTAITTPTLLTGIDGTGSFAVGQTQYIGFNMSNLAPDGQNY